MRRTVLLVAAAGVLLVACGGGGTGSSGGSGGSAAGGSATAPASYSYVNNGLDATFQVEGTSGTLVVTNGSGKDVGEPGIYSLDPTTGERVDATGDGAAPIADGAEGTFGVTFPDGFDLAAAGFVGLEFGGEDYGGFA